MEGWKDVNAGKESFWERRSPVGTEAGKCCFQWWGSCFEKNDGSNLWDGTEKVGNLRDFDRYGFKSPNGPFVTFSIIHKSMKYFNGFLMPRTPPS
jgi:hypothetical protein